MAQGLDKGATLKGGIYVIEKVLGMGSFGISYLANAKITAQGNLGAMSVNAKVAIKEFFMGEVNGRDGDGSTVSGSGGSVFTNYRNRFRTEAKNLSKLKHGNIVKVLDVFDENNTTYYVMEFLEGSSLDDYIKQKGHLSEEEAIAIIRKVGAALAYMHSCKMVHLDIKPKNIMRDARGEYFLIDFGLSKQFSDEGAPETSTSIGLGTPGYAPMEQSSYKNDGTFPATLDVYALGATMFKMLTGRRPPESSEIFNYGFPASALSDLGVSSHTIKVIEKAMASKKIDRYQDISSFIGDFGDDDATLIVSEGDDNDKTVISTAGLDNPVQVSDVVSVDRPGQSAPDGPNQGPVPSQGFFSKYKWALLGGCGAALIAAGALWIGGVFGADKEDVGNSESVVQDSIPENEMENAVPPVINDDQKGKGSTVVDEQPVVVDTKGPDTDTKDPEPTDEEQPTDVSEPTVTVAEMVAKGIAAFKSDDMPEAKKWLGMAADNGDAKAQSVLGNIYLKEGNREKAIELYKKAAPNGDTNAQISLGYMYYEGDPITGQNYVEARRLFDKAARSGNKYACYYLGLMYYYGQGGPKDENEARKWLEKSESLGNKEAGQKLESLELR